MSAFTGRVCGMVSFWHSQDMLTSYVGSNEKEKMIPKRTLDRYVEVLTRTATAAKVALVNMMMKHSNVQLLRCSLAAWRLAAEQAKSIRQAKYIQELESQQRYRP